MTKDDSNTRGQAFALEGIAAALVVILAVTFALSATAITPLTASTSNQQIEEQNRLVATDILNTAEQERAITQLALNHDGEAFVGLDDGDEGYSGPPINEDGDLTELGELLEETLDDELIAFNMYIQYQTEDGTESIKVVDQGVATDHSATAKQTLVLHEDMELPDSHPSETLGDLDECDPQFYAPNVDCFEDDSPVYNIVTIELEVWKL